VSEHGQVIVPTGRGVGDPRDAPIENAQESRSPAGRLEPTVSAMNKGITTVIYPVKDVEKTKALFRALMGDPAYDSPAYVGYNIEGQDIGIDPNARKHGLEGPVPYWGVDDIEATLQALLDAGAELVQPVESIGPGGKRAVVRDSDGNAIGILSKA
jgi:predicted enzyme related to lactoylglutathione lyase